MIIKSNMLKGTLLLLISLLTFSCQDVNKEKTYYKTGELHEEISLKEGLKDGLCVEYYKNGGIKFKKNWNEGKLHGKTYGYSMDGTLKVIINYKRGLKDGLVEVFYPSGKKYENQIYKKDTIVDFERFKADGSREDEMLAISRFQSDTVEMNEKITFKVKLGNISNPVFRKGIFIVTKEVIKNSPGDTIAMVESNNNDFTYEFEAKKRGANILKGVLIYRIPLDTIKGDLLKRFIIRQKYYVK